MSNHPFCGTSSSPRKNVLAAALSITLASSIVVEPFVTPPAQAAGVTSGDASRRMTNERVQPRTIRSTDDSTRLHTAMVHVLQELSTQTNASSRKAATRTIASMADSGIGSLREALVTAVDGDIVDVSRLKGHIVLSSALRPSANVTIRGPGKDQLVLDAQGHDR